ncbi:MAG: sigma factor [Acidobacteriota bacterium]|nr:sigma factor [Acidobacteriota bacterium]
MATSNARSRAGPNTHSLLCTAAVLSLAKVLPAETGIYQEGQCGMLRFPWTGRIGPAPGTDGASVRFVLSKRMAHATLNPASPAIPFAASGPGAAVLDSDAALMARVQAGDLDAFEPPVRRYERRLFGYFLNLVEDPAAADLAQETFVRVYRAAGALPGVRQVRILAVPDRREPGAEPAAPARPAPAAPVARGSTGGGKGTRGPRPGGPPRRGHLAGRGAASAHGGLAAVNVDD